MSVERANEPQGIGSEQRRFIVAFNTLSQRGEYVRGVRREGGTGVMAINSSPIGPPLILLLRFHAFFFFFFSSTPPPRHSKRPVYTRAISVNQIRRSQASQRRGQPRGRRWLLRSKWNA